ncbi:MAG: folate-binding protein [Pseudomonadota bacterium]
MAQPDVSLLPGRTVIAVGGEDRHRFLDGLLTAGVEDLAPGDLRYGALLTPQGKIITDMMIFGEADRIVLDVPSEGAADLVRRLSLYKLRADVTVRETDEVVLIGFGDEVRESAAHDPRAPTLGVRFVAPAESGEVNVPVLDRYFAARVAAVVPDAPDDIRLGEAFPHDANMDLTGGVDFKKGCFVGQEVVSRMRHRGTARRRTVAVRGEGPLPDAGEAFTVNGKPVGQMGGGRGGSGLAVLRIDKVAGHVEAGGVRFDVSVPDGAPFSLATD